jgi:hypothetical protein
MPLIRRLSTLVVSAVFGGSVLVGCVSSGSLVERGERIQTGKERFDGYFADVIELHGKVKELDSDLFPLRQPLTEAFDLNVDAPVPKLMAETRKRVERYKSFGVTVSLRLEPTPVVVLQKGELGQEEADEVTVKAIQEAAVRALATYREYGELLQLAIKLDGQREPLMEQLDKMGSQLADRKGAEAEILGAGRVLEEVQSKLTKDMRTCALVLVALAEAVETGAAEARDASCDEALAHHRPSKRPAAKGKRWGAGGWGSDTASEPRPTKPRGASPRAPTGGGGAAPPPPSPPPKKKSGGDFDM